MKNYYQLFHDKFTTSTELDEEFVRIYNTEGATSATNYLIKNGVTKLYDEFYKIEYVINECTKSENTIQQKEELLDKLKSRKCILNAQIGYDEKFKLPQYVIETIEGKIEAIEFSKINPEIKEIMPYIETDERMGKCFGIAYDISINLGVPNNIVTGYVYGYTDKSQFLHSWVEANIKGEEYVIDGTRNAIINKDGYYLLKHAEPINKISYETMRQDVHKYEGALNEVPLEAYFVFRDEIIRDLERNERLFDEER